MHNLSIDLETFSSEPIAKTGLYKYVQSRDFQVLLFAYSLDNAPVQVLDLTREELPEWLKAALYDPAYIKHAFNAAFEWYALSKHFGQELPLEQWGVKVMQNGPWPVKDAEGNETDNYVYDFIPAFTKICDLCADRQEKGKLPSCVFHCQAKCMEFGPVDELAKKAVKPRMALFTVR